MKKRLDSIEQNLAVLRAACGHVVLPENLPAYCVIVCADAIPCITFSINSAPNSAGREQLLALAGQLFGTDGWTKELGYGNKFFNWRKEWKGIHLQLSDAERVPLPQDKVPVRPTEFPILLTNAEANA